MPAHAYARVYTYANKITFYSSSIAAHLVLFYFNFLIYIVISSHETVSRAALLALQLLEVGLSKQESFLAQLKAQTSGTREINVTPLDELMMGINAHSGQADHLINVTKLVCVVYMTQSSYYTIYIYNMYIYIYNI